VDGWTAALNGKIDAVQRTKQARPSQKAEPVLIGAALSVVGPLCKPKILVEMIDIHAILYYNFV
jgi:hypothetical protein